MPIYSSLCSKETYFLEKRILKTNFFFSGPGTRWAGFLRSSALKFRNSRCCIVICVYSNMCSNSSEHGVYESAFFFFCRNSRKFCVEKKFCVEIQGQQVQEHTYIVRGSGFRV